MEYRNIKSFPEFEILFPTNSHCIAVMPGIEGEKYPDNGNGSLETHYLDESWCVRAVPKKSKSVYTIETNLLGLSPEACFESISMFPEISRRRKATTIFVG